MLFKSNRPLCGPVSRPFAPGDIKRLLAQNERRVANISLSENYRLTLSALYSRATDYKDMAKEIKSASKVNWPNTEPKENFLFTVNDTAGTFEFKFKWLNNRWYCWVTLPDGSVRQAGVFPGVINWTGFLDYGLVFVTDLTQIKFDQLYMTEVYILKWQ